MQKLLRILVAGVWALAVAWGLTLSLQTLRAEARDDASGPERRDSSSPEALH
jgi:hypothetical protein